MENQSVHPWLPELVPTSTSCQHVNRPSTNVATDGQPQTSLLPPSPSCILLTIVQFPRRSLLRPPNRQTGSLSNIGSIMSAARRWTTFANRMSSHHPTSTSANLIITMGVGRYSSRTARPAPPAHFYGTHTLCFWVSNHCRSWSLVVILHSACSLFSNSIPREAGECMLSYKWVTAFYYVCLDAENTEMSDQRI